MAVPLFHITALGAVGLMSIPAGAKIIMMRKWDAGKGLQLIEKEKVIHSLTHSSCRVREGWCFLLLFLFGELCVLYFVRVAKSRTGVHCALCFITLGCACLFHIFLHSFVHTCLGCCIFVGMHVGHQGDGCANHDA